MARQQKNPRESRKNTQDKSKPKVTLLDDSVNFLQPHLSFKERVAIGKAMRDQCSRTSHGTWTPDEKNASTH